MLDEAAAEGYRFVVFGDQKNLWKKKEFPALLARIKAMESDGGPPLLFIIDTGDIVNNGAKEEEFGKLKTLLDTVSALPYLVGVGNHEVQADKDSFAVARRNTAIFLGPNYAHDKLYFSKTIGPARFLFLNTNDLPGVYSAKKDLAAPDRAKAQFKWLAKELKEEVHPTIVVSHHPFIQSAGRHQNQAKKLWKRKHPELGDKTLPEALSDAGVELALTGHVHSYEIFKLKRNARQMWSLNASGLPKEGVKESLWGIFVGSRMPKNWQSSEGVKEMKKKFNGKDKKLEWTVTQLAYMKKNEKELNQYAVITVDKRGQLAIDLQAVNGKILYTMQITPP